MRLLLTELRKDQSGIIGKALLVLALMGAAAAGFIVLYSDVHVELAARVHDANYLADPVTAQLDVRVTNKELVDLVVDHVKVVVWADQAETVQLSFATVTAVVVPAGAARVVSVPLQIYHAEAFGAKVWVDVDASWSYGDQTGRLSVVGREISVGDALAKI